MPQAGPAAGPRTPFSTEAAPALLAGQPAHAVGKLPSTASAAAGLLLGHTAHSSGWPLPTGGSRRIADAIVADIVAHGGTFHTGHHVRDLAELDGVPLVMLDVSPKEFIAVAGDRCRRVIVGPSAGTGTDRERRRPNFLVDAPVPWRDPVVRQAGTVHLGGTRADVIRQENAAVAGRRSPVAGRPLDAPFVLVVDPAVVDPSRAVRGRRPVWAYAHVPNGDRRDPVDLIRRRIEEFVPRFHRHDRGRAGDLRP